MKKLITIAAVMGGALTLSANAALFTPANGASFIKVDDSNIQAANQGVQQPQQQPGNQDLAQIQDDQSADAANDQDDQSNQADNSDYNNNDDNTDNNNTADNSDNSDTN